MKSTRHYAEGLLCEVANEPNMGKHANTWGDAIFVGFENPNSGIEFALSLIEILKTRKIVARIGMGFGELSIAYNSTLKKMTPEGPTLSEGARLEPLAEPGQLLISETLRGKNLDETRFVFTREEKPLKKT
jgi:class 3 adenylate cyclase